MGTFCKGNHMAKLREQAKLGTDYRDLSFQTLGSEGFLPNTELSPNFMYFGCYQWLLPSAQ